MAAVSETIVREYFELHGFFVRQQRKFIAPSRRDEDEVDFLVINPHAQGSEEPLPFELASTDLARVSRALVVVKGWHTETFSQSMLTHAHGIFRFFEPAVFQQAVRAFGGDTIPTKLLIVPALPQAAEGRAQSIELLRSRGIDAVIPFRTLLADLIRATETNRNYQKSDLLQVIRVLKNYEFFRDLQLDLFTPAKRRKPTRTAVGPARPEPDAAAVPELPEAALLPPEMGTAASPED
jgi:hypothetical protein